MRSFYLFLFVCFMAGVLPIACVDPFNQTLSSTLDVVVVDGTITNLAEPQIIRLSRSTADPLTGRPGTTLLTKATVNVVVDSAQIVTAHETTDGTYQLPNDFRGQIGHAYQLRLTLSDGARYLSTQQVMPTVPSISRVSARFNAASLPAQSYDGQLNPFRGAHDFYIDTQDPVNQTNYYRWSWKQWEKQDWCRTCQGGVYSIHNVLINYYPNGIEYFTAGDTLIEDCFIPRTLPANINQSSNFFYDYTCRTECWAILYSTDLNVFADTYSNGGMISARKVAQVPFYQHAPCLVEIRQSSLTPFAYKFYKQLDEQTQKVGGVADTPPTASAGNVQQVASSREIVLGVFTASAVATVRYWLDRKDTEGIPPGLFVALNGREPHPEPSYPDLPTIQIIDNSSQSRPYTAVCRSNENQTPYKPDGWQN